MSIGLDSLQKRIPRSQLSRYRGTRLFSIFADIKLRYPTIWARIRFEKMLNTGSYNDKLLAKRIQHKQLVYNTLPMRGTYLAKLQLRS